MCPNIADATSFYRCAGPLSQIIKKYDIDLAFMHNESLWTWAVIAMGDAFMMQRPYTREHLEIATMIKRQNKPLWVEYDDDLLSVPIDNQFYDQFSDPETHSIIRTLIKMADVVTTCSPPLKEKFLEHNKNVVVIPNCFNHEMFKHFGEPPKERQKVVVWRGSNTHTKDLMIVKDQLLKLMKDSELKEWKWCFVGYLPFFLLDAMTEEQKLYYVPASEIIKYHQDLFNMKAALTFVSLTDSEFTRTKSNIAWIESTFAGNLVVAPDLPEWQRPGITNFRSPEEFFYQMKDMMRRDHNSEDRHTAWKQNQNDILANYNLEKWNEVRVQILEQITGHPLRRRRP